MFLWFYSGGGGGGGGGVPVPLGPSMFNHRKLKQPCMALQDNVVELSVHYSINFHAPKLSVCESGRDCQDCTDKCFGLY